MMRGDGADLDSEADPEAAVDPVPAAPVTTSDHLVWIASVQEALERSKAERRPVLVHFSTEWCADCKRMAQETFGDPRVQSQAGRFIAVRIDATNEEDPQVIAALQQYGVINVPTLILLDSAGQEQRRFTEFVRPDTLLSEIAHVR